MSCRQVAVPPPNLYPLSPSQRHILDMRRIAPQDLSIRYQLGDRSSSTDRQGAPDCVLGLPGQCMEYAVPHMIPQQYKSIPILAPHNTDGGSLATHVVLVILGEDLKELAQKRDELVCHFAQFMNVAIRIDIAESSTNRVVYE